MVVSKFYLPSTSQHLEALIRFEKSYILGGEHTGPSI